MAYRDAKITFSVKTVPHSNPGPARHLLAGLLLNQYLNAEAEKSRVAEEVQAAAGEIDLLNERARELGLNPETLASEIESLKAQLQEHGIERR